MWRRNRWIFGGGLAAFVVLFLFLRNAPRRPDPSSSAPPATSTAISPPTTSSAASRPAPPDDPLVWRTVGGHVGAVSRVKLEQAMAIAATGDKEAFDKLLANDTGVFVLAPGLEVYVSDADGVLGSVVKVRKKGTTAEIWTVREAIKR